MEMELLGLTTNKIAEPTTIECSSEHDYYYYFDIATLQAACGGNSNTTLAYLQYAIFNFQMYGCCFADPVTPYSVEFSLLYNCTANTASCFQKLNSCCWLPLASSGDEITVHCPGCKAPGTIVDRYYCRRSTFGFRDATNDRYADGVTANDIIPYNALLIHPNPPYPQYSLLNHGNAIIGDNIIISLGSTFCTGASDGYTYTGTMTSVSAFFKTLQLLRFIDSNNTLGSGFDMKLNRIRFYIDQRYRNSMHR